MLRVFYTPNTQTVLPLPQSPEKLKLDKVTKLQCFQSLSAVLHTGQAQLEPVQAGHLVVEPSQRNFELEQVKLRGRLGSFGLVILLFGAKLQKLTSLFVKAPS